MKQLIVHIFLEIEENTFRSLNSIFPQFSAELDSNISRTSSSFENSDRLLVEIGKHGQNSGLPFAIAAKSNKLGHISPAIFTTLSGTKTICSLESPRTNYRCFRTGRNEYGTPLQYDTWYVTWYSPAGWNTERCSIQSVPIRYFSFLMFQLLGAGIHLCEIMCSVF